MSDAFEWIVPNQIMRVVLPEIFDDAKAQEHEVIITSYLDKATHPFHIITDTRAVKVNPSLKVSTGLKYLKHPNMGRILTIGVTGNPLTRFLLSIFTRAVGTPVKDFSSEDEALAYLAAIEKK